MIIKEVEAYLCHYPLPEPFYPSWIPGFPQSNNSLIMLRLITDEGIDGYCAGVAFTEELKGLPALMQVFLLNRDPFNVEHFLQVFRGGRIIGVRPWFIEVALWDIIGKALGQPIYRLLGSCRERIKAYASTGELRDPERRAQDALALREKGFKAVKVRIRYPTMREDLAVVEAVREAVGDTMEIMVDANQAWLVHGLGDYPRWDFKRALATAKELEKLDVAWLEEPLWMFDYEGLSRLRFSTSVTISGGEMNADIYEFRELIERECYDILQPDVTLSGGILTVKKVAAMAEAHNMYVNPHTWTNGLGLVANMHVMGAIPNCTYCEYPYEPPGWIPEARDFLLGEPILVDDDGFVSIPDGPGLGVEIDMDKVAACGEKLI